jgi:hypothetical protein
MKIIDRLKRLLRIGEERTHQNGELTPDVVAHLLEGIVRTDEIELTCDEVLALMDQFAEMQLRGEDAAQILPLVQRHLEMCADCHEEYEALLRILRASPNGDGDR